MSPEKRAEFAIKHAVDAADGKAVISFPVLKENIVNHINAAVEEAHIEIVVKQALAD